MREVANERVIDDVKITVRYSDRITELEELVKSLIDHYNSHRHMHIYGRRTTEELLLKFAIKAERESSD